MYCLPNAFGFFSSFTLISSAQHLDVDDAHNTIYIMLSMQQPINSYLPLARIFCALQSIASDWVLDLHIRSSYFVKWKSHQIKNEPECKGVRLRKRSSSAAATIVAHSFIQSFTSFPSKLRSKNVSRLEGCHAI